MTPTILFMSYAQKDKIKIYYLNFNQLIMGNFVGFVIAKYLEIVYNNHNYSDRFIQR